MTNKNLNKFYIVVNPNAGAGKTNRDWRKINSLLNNSKLTFDIYFTKYAGDAINAVVNAVENGYRKFIALGGDGTLNEIINGLFSQNICDANEFAVGMIPVGTGNDWCRTYNIPVDYKKAIKIIEEQKIFVQDIGLVEISGKKQYFINVAGLGFDAAVAHKTNIKKQKGKGGKLSYLISIFSVLNKYKSKITKIITSEESIEIDLFSMNVGICKYNGGGMLQLPEAVPDDGLFDVTIIKNVSKFELIRNINKLFDGNILKHPKVINLRTNNLNIINNQDLLLETDGESNAIGNYKFSIIPKAMKVFIK
jgi:YegS/Rv2252/BmrU family lipid kinase